MSRLAQRPLDERGLPEGYPLQPDWEVTPRQVRDMQERGESFVLVDVREAREVAAASLSGSQAGAAAPGLPGVSGVRGVVWVPMGEVKSRLADLDEHADDKVVVMCHLGGRSMQVTAFLRQQGFSDVRSMAGGIDLWSRDIDPSVPRY